MDLTQISLRSASTGGERPGFFGLSFNFLLIYFLTLTLQIENKTKSIFSNILDMRNVYDIFLIVFGNNSEGS